VLRPILRLGDSILTETARPVDAITPEIETLIADANLAFPALKLTQEDVRLVHRGLVPAVKGRNGAPELRMMPEVYDHAAEGAPGAFSIAGAKYSSARGVAERTTNMVARRLGKRVAPLAKMVTASGWWPARKVSAS